MRIPIEDYLAEALDAVRGRDDGEPADYISELANADTEKLAIAIATLDGRTYSAGDSDYPFTIQSISKPFTYSMAIKYRGLDDVLQRIGVEPSGEAFNELSLEEGSKRPRNPMINAGAIVAHAMLGDTANERWEKVHDGFCRLAGHDLQVDQEVYEAEMESAHRNLAIGHMLRNYDILVSDPEEVVHGYIRQCAIQVTTTDLALMTATLANGGRQPQTGERVLSHEVVRQVLSVMTTCGMYDGTGEWIADVGIPAKSGVAGGIVGALPGQVGAATFSPRLDKQGNSVRGTLLFERLSHDMGMHMFEVPDAARSVISSIRTVDSDEGPYRLYELQGSLHFASAERILRAIAEDDVQDMPVVVDIDDVFTINDVAGRMLLETFRRLAEEDRPVTIVDPDGLLRDIRPSDEFHYKVVDARPGLTEH
ncbi:glutaminase [Blastococcus sp. Marseille-P5729]|uniref:glutaminase n=1 Tax=Blastococcus sp. Marseille-P5729 TaxID=2086582 RepID=UPI000D0F925D|nr:glutaminase [Blastococcus sp. Marseille-P5729]